ncbi:MAG TPA: hypothetical protein VHK91_15510, partial [Flavisolibacter sp.]|nr:hypothetical protein [Flavisolibacter sp.]
RGTYTIVVYGGGGLSYFTGRAGTLPDAPVDIHKLNRIGTFRLMWHPDHMLRVGLESGWVHFYSYQTEGSGIKGEVNVTAVPLLFVASMPVRKRFNAFAGVGSYLVTSKLDYNGVVRNTVHGLGWMFAASYIQPLSKRLGINTELKWLNVSGTKDASLSLQLHLVWRALSW